MGSVSETSGFLARWHRLGSLPRKYRGGALRAELFCLVVIQRWCKHTVESVTVIFRRGQKLENYE